MASFALAPRAGDTGLVRAPPKPLLLFAIAFAGCAAAGFSVVLALTSDHVREPRYKRPSSSGSSSRMSWPD